MKSAEPTSEPPEIEPSPPRWPLGTIVKVVVVLLLFGGLALALEGGWERLREYRWQFEPWAVGASLLVMIGVSVWAAVAWLAVARAFGVPLGALPALRIYSTSNLGKYLPGKVWHAFARVYLLQQEGVTVTLATTVVLTDVVLYIAAAMLVIVVALPTIVSALTDLNGPLVTAAALVGVVVGLALLHPAALNTAFGLARRVMPKRTFPTIEAGYGTILQIFVLYVVIWLLSTAGLYAGIQAVHPISAASLPTLGAIYALAYLAGLVAPIAPAGLGVREGLMAVLLSQLMPFPAAAAASVLVRVVQVTAEGLCAAAFSKVP